MRLKDKNALVTAAGQGIGRASVLAYLREGASVLATDVNAKALASLQEEARALGALDRLRIQSLDVTDAAAIEALPKEAGPRPINVLFNCAGYVHAGSVLDCSEKDWQFAWEINVSSMFRLIRVLLPRMRDNGGGSIINMSSVVSSVKGVPNRFVYSATKAARDRAHQVGGGGFRRPGHPLQRHLSRHCRIAFAGRTHYGAGPARRP